jgi:tRNA nucleotidyltransferase/poly(A) polymerase
LYFVWNVILKKENLENKFIFYDDIAVSLYKEIQSALLEIIPVVFIDGIPIGYAQDYYHKRKKVEEWINNVFEDLVFYNKNYHNEGDEEIEKIMSEFLIFKKDQLYFSSRIEKKDKEMNIDLEMKEVEMLVENSIIHFISFFINIIGDAENQLKETIQLSKFSLAEKEMIDLAPLKKMTEEIRKIEIFTTDFTLLQSSMDMLNHYLKNTPLKNVGEVFPELMRMCFLWRINLIKLKNDYFLNFIIESMDKIMKHINTTRLFLESSIKSSIETDENPTLSMVEHRISININPDNSKKTIKENKKILAKPDPIVRQSSSLVLSSNVSYKGLYFQYPSLEDTLSSMRVFGFRIQVPKKALHILSVVANAQHTCYIGGGFVRDKLLGLNPNDIDMTFNCTEEVLLGLFPDIKPDKKKLGLYHLYGEGIPIDISLSTLALEEEAKKRDMTINAFFIRIKENRVQVLDPLGNIKDLDLSYLKLLKNPDESLSEDPVRILRLIYYRGKLEKAINKKMLASIRKNGDKVKMLPMGVILSYMKRFFLTGKALDNIKYLHDNDLLSCFFPTCLKSSVFVKDNYFIAYWKKKWIAIDNQQMAIASNVETNSLIIGDVYFTKKHVLALLLLPVVHHKLKNTGEDKLLEKTIKEIVKCFLNDLTGACDSVDKFALQKGIQSVLAHYYLEYIESTKKEKQATVLISQFSDLQISKNKKNGLK